MIQPFSSLLEKYPLAANAFAMWCLTTYGVKMKQYDESIFEHRYIIAARFFGYTLEVPYGMDGYQMEEAIRLMFAEYQKALELKPEDPLKILNDMDWQERNIHTEKTFLRKTIPGLRDCLVPKLDFKRPSLFDTLVPFKGRSSTYEPVVNAMKDMIASLTEEKEERMWLDNIQWAWNVKTEKIEIPF